VYELSPRDDLPVRRQRPRDQGQPINYLGAHPLYGASEAFILPRGSAGRTPWTWQLNLRGGDELQAVEGLCPRSLARPVQRHEQPRGAHVDQNYTFDSVSPIVNGRPADLPSLRNIQGANALLNANFKNATAYQAPFSARIGAKLSF
jgi:hypothetical protein